MKKKINLALIIAVLGLWGVVGYRFINNYFVNEENVVNPVKNQLNLKNLIAQRDTFLLEPIVRDPFLGRVSVNNTGNRNSVKTKKRVTPKEKPVINNEWPSIQYFGYIRSGAKKELILVKINGQLHRMHKGEIKNDLLIQNVYKDSVIVVFNKEKRVFKHGK